MEVSDAMKKIGESNYGKWQMLMKKKCRDTEDFWRPRYNNVRGLDTKKKKRRKKKEWLDAAATDMRRVEVYD
ncbi:hypothetical protein QE152_g3522 [Popillia japonica]|uniref:Uncharacterized protein n=1 Tax=Popillia japonica TaxID=7064 RepID=A0AAW1N6F6_POPJA